jgi:hypothetical protein
VNRDSLSVETIICPNCYAELSAAADVCKHCGSSTSGPAGKAAWNTPRLRDKPWLMTILVLHLGAFGIPLYWKARYPRSVRLTIAVVSILYTIFVALAVAWGAMQIWRFVEMTT